jgi:hypothetical protein
MTHGSGRLKARWRAFWGSLATVAGTPVHRMGDRFLWLLEAS